VPVAAGGIIPESDASTLREAGVAAVDIPKDYELTEMLAEVAELAGGGARRPSWVSDRR
jgi:ethylmalonyl-CoA mutase